MIAPSLRPILQHLRASHYAFVTPTPATHARVNARSRNDHASTLDDVFGWNRVFAADIVSAHVLNSLRDAGGLVELEGDLFKSRFRISAVDDELFVHGAFPTDDADSVFLGPDTYRFVSALKECIPQLENVKRAVDIGCGTGAGGLVVAKLLPDAEVFLTDINDAALALAQENVAFTGRNNLHFKNSDLLKNVSGQFDLIIANPPYLLDAKKRNYRHGGGALGEGLSLAIVDTALERLNVGGTLILYTGSAVIDGVDHFKEAAAARLPGDGFSFSYREIDPDVFGEELDFEAYATTDRIAAVLLTIKRN